VQKEIKKIVGLSEDLVKSYENNLDKLTKEWNAKIEKIYTTKEAELMKV
jgi:ribosome recycling factor